MLYWRYLHMYMFRRHRQRKKKGRDFFREKRFEMKATLRALNPPPTSKLVAVERLDCRDDTDNRKAEKVKVVGEPTNYTLYRDKFLDAEVRTLFSGLRAFVCVAPSIPIVQCMYNILVKANTLFFSPSSEATTFFLTIFPQFVDMLHSVSGCRFVADKQLFRFRPLLRRTMVSHLETIEYRIDGLAITDADLINYFSRCPSFELSVHRPATAHDFSTWRLTRRRSAATSPRCDDSKLRAALREALACTHCNGKSDPVFAVEVDEALCVQLDPARGAHVLHNDYLMFESLMGGTTHAVSVVLDRTPGCIDRRREIPVRRSLREIDISAHATPRFVSSVDTESETRLAFQRHTSNTSNTTTRPHDDLHASIVGNMHTVSKCELACAAVHLLVDPNRL